MERTRIGRGLRRAVKEVVPPGLLRMARSLRQPAPSPYGYFGDYATFDAAMAEAKEGYASTVIVEKVGQQTLQLRDRMTATPASVLLDARVLQNLAGALLAISTVDRRPLSVLDFGGALGLHYFQLKPFLPGGAEMSWLVCETPVMADEGNRRFATEHLTFVTSLDDARGPFDLLISSGAIQCVPDPHDTLAKSAATADQILFNRLPLISADRDRLTIHKVDPAIYAASIPIWFLSERRWLAELEGLGFEIAMRWDVPQDPVSLDGEPLHLQGLLARRRRG